MMMQRQFSHYFTFGLFLIALGGFFAPAVVLAQELLQDTTTTFKAVVTEIVSSSQTILLGTDVETIHQKLEVKIVEGEKTGQIVTFDNDYTPLDIGEYFYLIETTKADDGRVFYSVSDPYRMDVIFILLGIFIILVVYFGGKQGIRGLLSLFGSLALIVYVLVPAILNGYSPFTLSIVVSSLIIVLGSYITHGFNKTTTSAVFGMVITVLVTGLLTHLAVSGSHLTGFGSEESVYLNLDNRGQIDLVGLLLGGMIIGLLGVLYDAAIGQAISVEELHRVAPHLSRWVIYKRAIRIGKEHIGALVNTLAIAYVGVSLPILLLFSKSEAPLLQILNRENFATEIIRTMVGSIGLTLAVPITTLIAVLIIIKNKAELVDTFVIRKEEEELSHFHHGH